MSSDEFSLLIVPTIRTGLNKIIDHAYDMVFAKLAHLITLNTTLCYHYTLEHHKLIIPIEINFKEIKIPKDKLITDKYFQLIKFLESIEIKKWAPKDKYAINLLNSLVESGSIIKVKQGNTSHEIIFNEGQFESVEASEHKFKDGTTIKQIVSPFVDDWGIYIDHSKKYEDFTLDYNVLHLFEHLAVPWKDEPEYVFQNGVTNVVGICFCTLITSTKKAFIKGINEYIDWHNKFRSNIDQFKKKIELEVIRTNYETLDGNSVNSFGKSFSSIYDNDYRLDILKYYASMPFTIIFVIPEKIDWKLIHELKPSPKVERPKPKRINKIPYTYFFNKELEPFTILSSSEKKRFNDPRISNDNESRLPNAMKTHKYYGNYVEGVDCILIPLFRVDLSDSNMMIRQISITPTEDLPKFIARNPLPFKNYGLYMLDRNGKNEVAYLIDN